METPEAVFTKDCWNKWKLFKFTVYKIQREAKNVWFEIYSISLYLNVVIHAISCMKNFVPMFSSSFLPHPTFFSIVNSIFLKLNFNNVIRKINLIPMSNCFSWEFYLFRLLFIQNVLFFILNPCLYMDFSYCTYW